MNRQDADSLPLQPGVVETMQNRTNTNHGFTLIELMIVIAIVGILASVAIPEYVKFAKRAKFSEVVASTTKFKTVTEVAYNLGVPLAEINSGHAGVPQAINSSNTHTKYLQSLTVTKGVIKATGSAEFDNTVYQIEPQVSGEGLIWSLNLTASTCLNSGFCSPP